MDTTTKTDKKDFEKWLLGFAHHIGRDCVVSLLVTENKVRFLSVVDKKRYLSDDNDPGDEEPDINVKSKINPQKSMKVDYFG